MTALLPLAVCGDFVDFVKEYNAVLLRSLQSLLCDCVLVHHLFCLLIDDEIHGLFDGEFSLFDGSFAHHTSEYATEVDFVAGRIAGLKLNGLWLLTDFHFDCNAVKMSCADFLQKLLFELSVALLGCARGIFAHGK